MIVTNGNSDWWTAVEKGMNDAAQEFGAQAEMRRNTARRSPPVKSGSSRMSSACPTSRAWRSPSSKPSRPASPIRCEISRKRARS